MRITIETTNPELVTKVMSICVANSTKSSPVWVMGEPDSKSTPPPAVEPAGNGHSKRTRKTCLNCRRGFLALANQKYCSKRCNDKYLYVNIYKPKLLALRQEHDAHRKSKHARAAQAGTPKD